MEATDSESKNRDSDEFASHEKDPPLFFLEILKPTTPTTSSFLFFFSFFFKSSHFTSFMGKQTPHKTNQYEVEEEEEE